MSSIPADHQRMETKMRELRVSTDINQFVLDLSGSSLPWNLLSDQLEWLSKRITEEFRPEDPLTEDVWDEFLEQILKLPENVCIPVTFAEPLERTVADVLNHLKDIHKLISAFGRTNCSHALKIKSIYCLCHLYTIATNLPLVSCLMITQVLHRNTIDAIVKFLNTVQLNRPEIDELRKRIGLKSLELESSLIGELGYTYFGRFNKIDQPVIDEWKEMIRKCPSIRPLYQRVLIRKALPFIDHSVRRLYFEHICKCLSMWRMNTSELKNKDLFEVTSLKLAYTNYFIGPTFRIFKQSLLLESNLKQINLWLSLSLDSISNPSQLSTDLRGEWGTIEIMITESEVLATIVLSSYFDKQVEYSIRCPKIA